MREFFGKLQSIEKIVDESFIYFGYFENIFLIFFMQKMMDIIALETKIYFFFIK